MHGTATNGNAYVVINLKESITLSDDFLFVADMTSITITNCIVSLQKGTTQKTNIANVSSNNDVSSVSKITNAGGEVATSIQVGVPEGTNVDGWVIKPQLIDNATSWEDFSPNFGSIEEEIDDFVGERTLYFDANSKKFTLEIETLDGLGIILPESSCCVIGENLKQKPENILTRNEDLDASLQAISKFFTQSMYYRRWTALISTDVHGDWEEVKRQIEYLNNKKRIIIWHLFRRYCI